MTIALRKTLRLSILFVILFLLLIANGRKGESTAKRKQSITKNDAKLRETLESVKKESQDDSFDEMEEDEEEEDEDESEAGKDKARRDSKTDKGPKIWDQWSKWSACSVTCGIGKITRWRHCVSGGCSSGEKEAQIKTCTLSAC